MSEDQRPTDDLESTRTTEQSDLNPPARIGEYRILQKLGEGGMGEVYEAEQEKPVRRKVALKLIKLGMDSKQVLARFESERQALALMSHPVVAKVFDAGTSPQGRPFLAMEYVKGEPITAYCDRHRLTNLERLELFMQVCEGVQHAHQRGIIHRDIKPSNVLVAIQDDKPVPKIIDFGVAKATEQRLTEKTVFTQMGVLIGTPEYMSPEQAEMTVLDIDTRTDVYSLGVMLYELLVGALPFDRKELRQAGFEGIRKKIREEEPPRPSTRLSTLGEQSTESAQRRRVDLSTLQRQLRGDLDWITMRALEKDRTRRYDSPHELAADIERHLRDQPVLAGPPSMTYRARKFVRRHKVGVGVAAAGLVVLIAFAGAMAYQAKRIARERDRANQEAESSERVAKFLADMLGNVDPQVLGLALWKDQRQRAAEVRRGRGATEDEIEAVLASLEDALSGVNATDVALRLVDEQILSRTGETIEQELADEPRIAGRLEHTLGDTYRRLGLYDPAERHALRAVETRRRVLGQDHPHTLQSMNVLATAYWSQGRAGEADRLYRETLETQRRVLGHDHPDTLRSMHNLALAHGSQGRYDEAEKLHRETLESLQRVLGPDHSVTLSSMNGLANTYYSQGRYDEARKLHRETLEIRRRVLGRDHPDTLTSMHNLSNAYSSQNRYDEAEKLYRETLEIRKQVLGRDHPDTLTSMHNLANAYSSQGRYDEAEKLHRETLGILQRVLGRDHPDTLWSMYNLANAYYSQGRHNEAEELHRETLEIRRRVLGRDHPDTLFSMNGLAWLLLTHEPAGSRDPQTALQLALEVAERTGHKNLNYLDTLSLAYHLTGGTAKAIENQKRAIALLPEGESVVRRELEEALAKFEAALQDKSE